MTVTHAQASQRASNRSENQQKLRSRTNALVPLPTTPHRHTLTAAADKTSRLRIWVTTRRTANRSDLHQNQLLITMAAITSLSGWD